MNPLPDDTYGSILKNDADVITFRKNYLTEWLTKILNHNVLIKDKLVSIFSEYDGSSTEFINFKTQNDKNNMNTNPMLIGAEFVSTCIDK